MKLTPELLRAHLASRGLHLADDHGRLAGGAEAFAFFELATLSDDVFDVGEFEREEPTRSISPELLAHLRAACAAASATGSRAAAAPRPA